MGSSDSCVADADGGDTLNVDDSGDTTGNTGR